MDGAKCATSGGFLITTEETTVLRHALFSPTNKWKKKIKVWEDLAKAQHEARLYFLGLKNKNELQERMAKTEAAPIVAPIVAAIKSSKAVNRPPQSEEDVRRIFLQLQKMRFESLK